MTTDGQPRCPWPGDDPLMVAYHDLEWGVPLHDDRALFELLVLEGAQAGLSWRTVLHRREGYRVAFEAFDVERVAAYGEDDVARLLADPRIIRNRAKVDAAIANARAVLEVQHEHGSFDAFVWSFAPTLPERRLESLDDIPAETEESRSLSQALKKRGFGFVGPTICYAFMQSAGLVDDHLATCFRATELGS